MHTIDTVLRSMRGDDRPQRRDHLQIFREFIDHLDRAARRKPARQGKTERIAKVKGRGKRR